MQSSVILYTNPVRTSQETHYVSATKPNRLMLFRETVAVYCHTEHANTLCGQNTEFLIQFLLRVFGKKIKAGGGRSVGIVRLRTKATEFVCLFVIVISPCCLCACVFPLTTFECLNQSL
jgi:hypothetical protein